MTEDRKTVNLTVEDDVKQWKKIKKQMIQKHDDPDFKDTQMLREMMDVFVGRKPQPDLPDLEQ